MQVLPQYSGAVIMISNLFLAILGSVWNGISFKMCLHSSPCLPKKHSGGSAPTHGIAKVRHWCFSRAVKLQLEDDWPACF